MGGYGIRTSTVRALLARSFSRSLANRVCRRVWISSPESLSCRTKRKVGVLAVVVVVVAALERPNKEKEQKAWERSSDSISNSSKLRLAFLFPMSLMVATRRKQPAVGINTLSAEWMDRSRSSRRRCSMQWNRCKSFGICVSFGVDHSINRSLIESINRSGDGSAALAVLDVALFFSWVLRLGNASAPSQANSHFTGTC